MRYLDFDYSEDTAGIGVFDAMASTGTQQAAAVRAEAAEVLAWAHATFPGRRGPVGEGGDWDYDLQGMRETTAPETIEFDEHTHALQVRLGAAGAPRHTLTLSVTGTSEFCEAFRQRFG